MIGEADRDRFKRAVSTMLEDGAALREMVAFQGGKDGDPLEHHTRRSLIDPFLEALGWSFGDRIEEARVETDTTLFIDYLGIDRERRDAEMVFEAKLWTASEIIGKGSYTKLAAGPLAARAANWLKKKRGAEPLTKGWMERIDQLRSYVVGIADNKGFVVQRAVISSGCWIIIFKNPKAAFIDGDPIDDDDVLALSGEAMVARSDEIFDLMSISGIGTGPREPVPHDELILYLRDPAHVRRIFRAVHVARSNSNDSYTARPSIFVSPRLVVERSDGQLLPLRHPDLSLPLPHHRDELPTHIDLLTRASDAMLADLERFYGVALPAPSPVTDFPNFRLAGGDRSPVLRYAQRAGNFLVATGTEAHYLRAEPEVMACPFHLFDAATAAGRGSSTGPVIARSFEQRAFFTNGEAHHCAHRDIEIAKKVGPCPIDGFEGQLCCRSCALQDRCWSRERLATAPCDSGPRVAPGAAAAAAGGAMPDFDAEPPPIVRALIDDLPRPRR
jgi:hypothetical protein